MRDLIKEMEKSRDEHIRLSKVKRIEGGNKNLAESLFLYGRAKGIQDAIETCEAYERWLINKEQERLDKLPD